MAGVYWLAVVVFLLSGNRLDAVDLETVKEIYQYVIRSKIATQGQFSVAINVPLTSNGRFDKSQENDILTGVRKKSGIYYTTWMAAADDRKDQTHTEYRVLSNMENLKNTKQDKKLMFFYSNLSPCPSPCTSNNDKKSILDKLRDFEAWQDYALVFKKPFTQPKSSTAISPSDLKSSLERLSQVKIRNKAFGLDHIFRCDAVKGVTQCLSCKANDGGVRDWCVTA